MYNSKRRLEKFLLLGGVIFLSSVVFCFNFQYASAQMKVKLKAAAAFPPPEGSAMSEVLKIWEDDVTKRTKGQITFETYWGASLGAQAEHIDLLGNGIVDVAQFYEWFTPGKLPIGDFEYVFPFSPTDYEIMLKALRQIRSEFPQFTRDYTRHNIIMICDPPGAQNEFMSKIPAKTVADFNGKKVAIIGRYFGRWLPPGTTAVVRPAYERYDLLRTGIVDMNNHPFELQYALKIHEVTKYYIKVDMIAGSYAPIFMNLDTFKKFSPEIQKILLEVGKDVELRSAKEVLPRWWNKCSKEWKAAGIEFIEISQEEKAKWVAMIEDTPAEWAEEMEGKGYPAFKIVQRWQKITSELGHKWPRKWGIKK